jgi:hypothetical protein
MLMKTPKTSTERVHHHRRRIKAGRNCLTIETDLGKLGDVLRAFGTISPTAEDDPELLARGLDRLIQNFHEKLHALEDCENVPDFAKR